ncbi:MAG: murein L,D-transpeptidase catalytic domain-containing protein [Gemmatirosa sp.]
MRRLRYLQHALIGGTAVLLVGAQVAPGNAAPGPVVAATAAYVRGETSTPDVMGAVRARSAARGEADAALEALASAVRTSSHPRALEEAFRSYFAYRTANPERVRKPFLYFVDYGLPSTEPRGYVFDMDALAVVDGPFMVAHGRGSAASSNGVPQRFSNVMGSAATSLGLYVAQELYDFRGKSAGQAYRSTGLRLMGVSRGFNDNARARGVVAHGAPYVTASRAGRSEGCPAVEQERAEQLLPKLANGGMVFLFAPDQGWMSHDPWIAAAASSMAG